MAEYYAVERSPEYLAHYGIRGMKWGVRKAKYKGNDKALARQYAKAQKKIQKYKDKMNIDKQKEASQYHYGKMIRSGLATGGVGAVGVGGLLGSLALHNKKIPTGFINVHTHDAATGKTVRMLQPVFDSSPPVQKALAGVGIVGSAATLGLAGKTGYHAAKALSAQYRSSKTGHKRAVKKYAPKVNEWQREVNKAFAGTKYAKKRRK